MSYEKGAGKPVGRKLNFKLIGTDNGLYIEEQQSKIILFKVEF